MLYKDNSTYFVVLYVFFFKQKTAYEMRISDWSSDVCSSDLADRRRDAITELMRIGLLARAIVVAAADVERALEILGHVERKRGLEFDLARDAALDQRGPRRFVHRRLREQFGRILIELDRDQPAPRRLFASSGERCGGKERVS